MLYERPLINGMRSRRASKIILRIRYSAIFLLFFAASRLAGQQPVDLKVALSTPFRFVAYGDTRFIDPGKPDAETAASGPIRRALVQAIADTHPAFISIGGDLATVGSDPNDWKNYDGETASWRQQHIPVYPALGNHDVKQDERVALGNFFQRFPELKQSRYYSVHAANVLLLMLDTNMELNSGPQAEWLRNKLDAMPSDVDFVVFVMHHPPYTNSMGSDLSHSGHAARSPEQTLAKMLEERQAHTRARFVVFAGHVHNYERQEHNGVTYFVTGGGGAHPHPVMRLPGDPFADKSVNFHYLLVEVDAGKMTITMNRVEMNGAQAVWTKPDSITIKSLSLRPARGNK